LSSLHPSGLQGDVELGIVVWNHTKVWVSENVQRQERKAAMRRVQALKKTNHTATNTDRNGCISKLPRCSIDIAGEIVLSSGRPCCVTARPYRLVFRSDVLGRQGSQGLVTPFLLPVQLNPNGCTQATPFSSTHNYRDQCRSTRSRPCHPMPTELRVRHVLPAEVTARP